MPEVDWNIATFAVMIVVAVLIVLRNRRSEPISNELADIREELAELREEVERLKKLPATTSTDIKAETTK